MIRPGLLTASTSKADHLGMSTDRVACLSMIGAPFALVVLVFGLENAFSPSVVELAHDWAPERTSAGPERREGCDPFPRNDSLSQGLGTWTSKSWSLITWFLCR